MPQRNIALGAVLALLCATGLAYAASDPGDAIGIGGGSTLRNGGISPHDSNLMLVSSDRGAAYISRDAGASWALIPASQVGNGYHCEPVFDPVFEKTVFLSDGPTLNISLDAGRSWQPFLKGSSPWQDETILHVSQQTVAKTALYVGTTRSLYMYESKSGRWKRLSKFYGECRGVVALATRTFAAQPEGVYQSFDGGVTWQLAYAPPDGHEVLSLAGGYISGSKMVVLAAISQLGVAGSDDFGRTWSVVLEDRAIVDVAMAANQNRTALAATASTVHRTDDGGGSWKTTFNTDSALGAVNAQGVWINEMLGRPYTIAHACLGICDMNSTKCLLAVGGALYVSGNSGAVWKQVTNTPRQTGSARPPSYASIGLESNCPWEYYIDTHKKINVFIAYSELGLAAGADRGKTWRSAMPGCPFQGTVYNIAIDPFRESRIYAAIGGQPGIPSWDQIDHVEPSGGVAVSDDNGLSWRPAGTGLPNLPCTFVTIDPKSTKNAVTLYAAVYGDGVYKSTDAGKTWERKSLGLGREGNNHVFMVKVHPASGDVYCSITGSRSGDDFPVAGGLWHSTNGGETWEEMTTGLELHWPGGFDFDTRYPPVLYLAASSIPGSNEGGLYRFEHGDKIRSRVRKDADFVPPAAPPGTAATPVRAWFVSVSPHDQDHVYVSTMDHGLWLSKDANTFWTPLDWVPFSAVTRVCFPPVDKSRIIVSTYGAGVWKGPAVPGEALSADDEE